MEDGTSRGRAGDRHDVGDKSARLRPLKTEALPRLSLMSLTQNKFRRHGVAGGSLRLLALAGLLCGVATALGTSPELKSVIPTGGQRGTELEVSFGGERLEDTEEVICYEPGLEVSRLVLVTNKLVQARIKILPDCSLGEHHLRLRTATGLSGLRTFLVGPFPVVEEREPNNDPAHAQSIELNTTVTGVIKAEDVDYFEVELKKGQRLSAEVEGIRLGRSLFDSRLTVLDAAGVELADVDDTWLGMQDPFVSLLAPNDGKYIVRLREAGYGGGNDCHYRLHLGSFPRPTSVFPLGGRAGDSLRLTFYSGATGEFVQEVKLPPQPSDRFGVFAELDGLTAPTPNWLRVSEFPNVLAVAPNQDRTHATVADHPPPLALNGIIAAKGREDWFCVPATKGVPLELEVYARRLRSPLDSVVQVFDDQGHEVAANDDSAGADSSLKFTPAATTNYFVRIRDTLGQGGRDFAYRIEITPVRPAIGVKIPEVARNDTQSRQFITVPRGNRFATLVAVKRTGFGGELRFEVRDLPPGVTMQADQMAKNIEAMPLVFEAAADAPLGGRLLGLTSTGSNGKETVVGRFRQNVELVQGPPNNANYYATSVDKLCVAVTREAPFHLRIVEPQVPLVKAGSMRLEIIAERASGFDEPIQVQTVWNPPGVSSESEITLPKGATNGFYQLNANPGAETRTWKVAVLGHATVQGGAVYVSSQLADLQVAEPFLTGHIETLWLNPGKKGSLTVSLKQTKAFEGKATIRLCGLPEHVTASEREITKDDQDVVFELAADENCRPGSYKNLFCSVEVPDHGQLVPHNIGQGGILRVVMPKKPDAGLAAAQKK